MRFEARRAQIRPGAKVIDAKTFGANRLVLTRDQQWHCINLWSDGSFVVLKQNAHRAPTEGRGLDFLVHETMPERRVLRS
jgi:hypothetical protein